MKLYKCDKCKQIIEEKECIDIGIYNCGKDIAFMDLCQHCFTELKEFLGLEANRDVLIKSLINNK